MSSALFRTVSIQCVIIGMSTGNVPVQYLTLTGINLKTEQWPKYCYADR